MKKILLSLVLAVGLSSQAAQITLTVLPGTMTNLLGAVNGMAKVSQIIVAASTSTNVYGIQLIDTPTNQLGYATPAYSNTVSYATNNTGWSVYTNYFGVTTTITNFTLVDVTNNVVAATTNLYPIRAQISTLGGTSTRADNVNYWFSTGIWVTNSGAVGTGGPASVTITYQQ